MRLLRYIISLTPLFLAFSAFTQDNDPYMEGLSSGDQLIIAADKGDTIAVLNLISKGAGVNATTNQGVTPLMFAAQNGNHEMVKLLLRNGAKPDLKTDNGYTALILCIYNGQIQTAEDLIRNGANINLPDNRNVTPLMLAIKADSFFMPDMLLFYGASADHRDDRGINALMLASKYDRYEIAIKLLETGMDIYSVDEDGNTPLHYAASAGHTDIMELLILNGALIDTKNYSGFTPLSLLIGYGADVNSTITNKLNPLTLALNNRNDALATMLKNNDAKAIQHLSFDLWSFGTRYTFNRYDSQLGFIIGLSDRKYNLMTSLGFGFRPKTIQILEEADQNLFYQYWEKRRYVSVSIDKAFLLNTGGSAFTSGVFAGFSEVLTFGSYKGSEEKPVTKLIINPRIGVIGEFGALRLKLSYEFMNLRLENYDKGWFNIALEFLISRKKMNINIP
jgi:ankyrin repeat protein